MWISRKKINSLEKSIADLEKEVRDQQNAFLEHLNNHEEENRELRKILENMKKGIYRGIEQIL